MSQSATTVRAPTPLARSITPGRFVALWAGAWALIGLAVALGIMLTTRIDPLPAIRISLLFAEVVGFTALVGARLVFPLFERMPYALSLLLQVLTLISGTLFGSLVVLIANPLFSLNRPGPVLLIVLINAVLAVTVGIALHTYDTMRRQIEQSYEALREKEALDRELRIARDVQQQLLPVEVPQVKSLELAGLNIPAIGVGGDYFDYLLVSENRIGLVIADVSGKGVPASLLMAGIHAAVRSLVLSIERPALVSQRLNQIIYRSSSSARYATFFLGFFDGETGQLSYCNAGHLPPLIIRNGAAQSLEFGELPIGMFEETDFSDRTITLGQGDLIALFTDGIIEAPDPHDVEFGEARLLALLQRHRELPVDEIISTVISELQRWSETPIVHDDLTLVLARVR